METKRAFLNLASWALAGLALTACAPAAQASDDAPAWMHNLVSRTVPPQDDKTNAVVLYDETDVTVESADKVKTVVRRAYKILRPNGRDYGTVIATFNSNQKITNLHGWCIPAQGKDYSVKDKDAVQVALPKIDGSELISDVKAEVLHIPAADVGNIVGYEYEIDEQPLVMQDIWHIQEEVPILEAHYKLMLPAGWEYKDAWVNAPAVKAVAVGATEWDWSVENQKAVRPEDDMPPIRGIAGRAVFSFLGPSASSNSFANWNQMGVWYRNLTAGRTEASPEIKAKVAALTAGAPTPLARMKAIAQYIQHNTRYVAIELGIGGWQPHPASKVFSNRYGDCKDKATLAISMLNEVGIVAYYVVINTERGGVGPNTPAYNAFDHAIVAIKLPAGVSSPALTAIMHDPKLGDLLFFDPTDELTPFGSINGALQANYGLLVTPDGGELVEVPQLSPDKNGIARTAHLTLDSAGTLQGSVQEIRVGDPAWEQRWALRTVTSDNARVKPVESLLAASLSTFNLTAMSIVNRELTDQPFGFDYSFQAPNYAKVAGNLLLVRPRVLGVKTSGILETKEPRQYPVEFSAPEKDTDSFEITLPPGYVVDELPPPVDVDYGFASYHSKTEAKGNAIAYTRTYEIKQLSVPVDKLDQLKKFYRIVATDERSTAVIRPQ